MTTIRTGTILEGHTNLSGGCKSYRFFRVTKIAGKTVEMFELKVIDSHDAEGHLAVTPVMRSERTRWRDCYTDHRPKPTHTLEYDYVQQDEHGDYVVWGSVMQTQLRPWDTKPCVTTGELCERCKKLGVYSS
jgi:hypothetical protein